LLKTASLLINYYQLTKSREIQPKSVEKLTNSHGVQSNSTVNGAARSSIKVDSSPTPNSNHEIH
jgi:hypothetical protein